MALIHILDEVTANQIAAGEVVERPVNAVKELVENAVDADAHEIEVEIADGGMTYIRVTDNGCGMTEEDARLSVVRHATSKISTVDNIYHIASLGFRGEALPSIMSVSRSAITTRRPEDVEGTVLEMEGGDLKEVRPCGAPAGTTVEVRDLFYNVPARKKFLKSERTESSRINIMVGKLALANPDISFRLINNGRTVIETPGNGRLMDAVSALYGTKTAGEMLPVKDDSEIISLEGMISKPSLLKSSRQYQTIIINRRVVESAVVTKAVDNAYHSLLPKNGYPLMVLAFQVPPESIDVNVHPQKREIKFSDEQTLFRMVYHAILGTLTSQSSADTIAREMIRDPGHEVVHGGVVDGLLDGLAALAGHVGDVERVAEVAQHVVVVLILHLLVLVCLTGIDKVGLVVGGRHVSPVGGGVAAVLCLEDDERIVGGTVGVGALIHIGRLAGLDKGEGGVVAAVCRHRWVVLELHLRRLIAVVLLVVVEFEVASRCRILGVGICRKHVLGEAVGCGVVGVVGGVEVIGSHGARGGLVEDVVAQ